MSDSRFNRGGSRGRGRSSHRARGRGEGDSSAEASRSSSAFGNSRGTTPSPTPFTNINETRSTERRSQTNLNQTPGTPQSGQPHQRRQQSTPKPNRIPGTVRTGTQDAAAGGWQNFGANPRAYDAEKRARQEQEMVQNVANRVARGLSAESTLELHETQILRNKDGSVKISTDTHTVEIPSPVTPSSEYADIGTRREHASKSHRESVQDGTAAQEPSQPHTPRAKEQSSQDGSPTPRRRRSNAKHGEDESKNSAFRALRNELPTTIFPAQVIGQSNAENNAGKPMDSNSSPTPAPRARDPEIASTISSKKRPDQADSQPFTEGPLDRLAKAVGKTTDRASNLQQASQNQNVPPTHGDEIGIADEDKASFISGTKMFFNEKRSSSNSDEQTSATDIPKQASEKAISESSSDRPPSVIFSRMRPLPQITSGPSRLNKNSPTKGNSTRIFERASFNSTSSTGTVELPRRDFAAEEDKEYAEKQRHSYQINPDGELPEAIIAMMGLDPDGPIPDDILNMLGMDQEIFWRSRFGKSISGRVLIWFFRFLRIIKAIIRFPFKHPWPTLLLVFLGSYLTEPFRLLVSDYDAYLHSLEVFPGYKLAEFPKTALFRAAEAEQTLQSVVRKTIPAPETEDRSYHPCTVSSYRQFIETKPLLEAEKQVLAFVYKNMLPSLHRTIFFTDLSAQNLTSIYNDINQAIQDLVNLDRQISQHIHKQRLDSRKCVKIHGHTVSVPARSTFHPESKFLPALRSIYEYLAQFAILARFLPPNFFKNSHKGILDSGGERTAALYATPFDNHFRLIERNLRRSQRGHQGLRDELRRMENDINKVAKVWFSEEQILLINMSNMWSKRFLETASNL